MARRVQETGVALKKRDLVKEALDKHDVKEVAEVDRYKTMLKLLKESKEGKEVAVPKDDEKAEAPSEQKEDGAEKAAAEAADKDGEAKEKEAEVVAEEAPGRKRREGAINLQLFMKVAELSLCSQDRESKDNGHCVNLLMVERVVHEALDARQQGNFKKGR